MSRVTVSITDEVEAVIEEKVGDGGEYDSKSEFVRECIQQYEDRNERVAELEQEVERLRNEKQTLIEQREENQALVRYVEDERRVEQQWRETPMWTRVKWRVFGMPSEPSS